MGSHSQPEGSAWAAYLASPSSSAMSPMPSAEKASQWVSSGHKVSSCSLHPYWMLVLLACVPFWAQEV